MGGALNIYGLLTTHLISLTQPFVRFGAVAFQQIGHVNFFVISTCHVTINTPKPQLTEDADLDFQSKVTVIVKVNSKALIHIYALKCLLRLTDMSDQSSSFRIAFVRLLR